MKKKIAGQSLLQTARDMVVFSAPEQAKSFLAEHPRVMPVQQFIATMGELSQDFRRKAMGMGIAGVMVVASSMMSLSSQEEGKTSTLVQGAFLALACGAATRRNYQASVFYGHVGSAVVEHDRAAARENAETAYDFLEYVKARRFEQMGMK